MKKFRTITSVGLISVMTICMCGMIFGYTNNDKFFVNTRIVKDMECKLLRNPIQTSDGDNNPMQPYYDSIESGGEYEVGMYVLYGSTWTEYDSADKKVYVDADSGFYTSMCDFSTTKGNYPFIRSKNGMVMNLDHLKVRYNK